ARISRRTVLRVHLCSAPAPPAFSPLSLHDALPIFRGPRRGPGETAGGPPRAAGHAHSSVRRRPCLENSISIQGRRRSPFPSSRRDRKSTRLNSSHVKISYAVFCLKKKKTRQKHNPS